jgi:two-component system chemotaxis response regulator CheB
MEAGALIMLNKPMGISHPGYEEDKKKLISTVKLMSEIKVVGRRRDNSYKERKSFITDNAGNENIKIIAIGASTGGPQVLNSMFKYLCGRDFPPVLLVQHITSGFTKGFAD